MHVPNTTGLFIMDTDAINIAIAAELSHKYQQTRTRRGKYHMNVVLFVEPLLMQEADVALNMPVLADVVHNPPMAQFKVLCQHSNTI